MLKLGITKVGAIVIGRVLEQSVGLYDKGFLVEIVENKKIRQIRSSCSPSLGEEGILYVRGSDREEDNAFFAAMYENVVANEVIADIKRLVAKLNHPDEDKGVELGIGLEVVE